MAGTYINKIAKWFYPPRCILCGKLLPLEQEVLDICFFCSFSMPWIVGNSCKMCGKSTETGVSMCHRCEKSNFLFEGGVAVFPYEFVKRAIIKFKFKEFPRDGIPLSNIMADYLKNERSDVLLGVDMLVPIPMFYKKKKRRGFNQAEILAEGIGKNLNILCVSDNLLRTRNTKPQSELAFGERKENIRGAFFVMHPDEILGKNILLIDDIFTTGSTINECSRMLYDSGANSVKSFVLAVTGDI